MKIGYARVSTDDQNTDLQTDALKAEGCEKIFTESISGAKRDRPELKRLLEQSRKGDVIIVWSLSRLSRSMKHLIETVEQLDALGVGLISLKERIDTTSATGRLTFHIFGALAEFEREQLRERTLEGLAAAKARGRIGGRPRALNDNDMVAAKAMLSDPSITVSDVARRFGVGRTTLYRALGDGGRASL